MRRPFPLATPTRGYTLVDAALPADVPAAIVWPKPAGSAPFILERMGNVKQVTAPGATREVLDISGVVAMNSEGGALGMALHPLFDNGAGPKPFVFLWYNAQGSPKNKQRLSRFTWNAATQVFDRASETILLEEEEEKAEHKAGRMQFGPDGFLYFGNGDDINDANHQRLDRALFAGIFRIDVDSQGGAVSHPPPRQPAGGFSAGYFIPNNNPFVGTPNALEEYFALGLRNPFGFSFDRATGALWVADVGETWREEVNLVVAGGNYEWPYREGDVIRGSTPATIGTLQLPKYSYTHSEMADLAAVIGGFVYRGADLPELVGKYIYSDWPSGRVWALDNITAAGTGAATRTTLIDNQWKHVPMALAEDNNGEIYLLHLGGISKLARAPNAQQLQQDLPKRLTETMLFKDVAAVAALELEPDVVPYEINSPLWSDGAAKRRWISMPKAPVQAHVEVQDDGSLKLPVGTLIVKHFELPPNVTPAAGRTRRLETRVLVVGTDTVYGLSYRWNAQGTDAELVSEPAAETIQDAAGGPGRKWEFPSFGQCWSCHRSENRILGFNAPQIKLTTADGKDQLATLASRGVLDPAAIAKMPPGIARPSDVAATLDARASAYLAANCSSCHHPGASFLGGNDTWNALAGVPAASRGLIGAPHHNYPMASRLNLPNAPLVAAGNPNGSLLLARIKSTDPDLQMPPLGRHAVDPDGVLLIEQWIQSLPAQ